MSFSASINFLCWLVYVNSGHFGSTPSWEDASIIMAYRQAYRAFSWLLIDMEGSWVEEESRLRKPGTLSNVKSNAINLVLLSCHQLYKSGVTWERRVNWGTVSSGLPFEVCSWLMTDVGGTSSLQVVPPLGRGPRLYKKADWISSNPSVVFTQFLSSNVCRDFPGW